MHDFELSTLNFKLLTLNFRLPHLQHRTQFLVIIVLQLNRNI